jgi:hypothetical protein
LGAVAVVVQEQFAENAKAKNLTQGHEEAKAQREK